jgi:hypothetical protein
MLPEVAGKAGGRRAFPPSPQIPTGTSNMRAVRIALAGLLLIPLAACTAPKKKPVEDPEERSEREIRPDQDLNRPRRPAKKVNPETVETSATLLVRSKMKLLGARRDELRGLLTDRKGAEALAALTAMEEHLTSVQAYGNPDKDERFDRLAAETLSAVSGTAGRVRAEEWEPARRRFDHDVNAACIRCHVAYRSEPAPAAPATPVPAPAAGGRPGAVPADPAEPTPPAPSAPPQ